VTDDRPHILIADDEPSAREALAELLRGEGYRPSTVGDGLEALRRLESGGPELLIADLKMPRLGGLELIKAIEARRLPTSIIVLTGRGCIETAVETMKHGAYDYLTKPVVPPRLLELIPKALDAARVRRALHAVREPGAQARRGLKRMLGATTAMREVFHLVETVAASSANVMILGESGTGKELVARGIHDLSRRTAQPFVSINSAALPPDLLESELFGHERGAFTGATGRKEGCFELAHQGTLFLDEVADMAMATQAKLLRVLEGHGYRRLGGTQEITVDVRVIAATNQDVDHALEQQAFRRDLYFRLSTVVLRLPALRERVEDIPLLVREFLGEFARQNDKQVEDVSPAAMDCLLRYPWPGNVRELRNAIEHAVILSPGEVIGLEHLPAAVREPARAGRRMGGFYLCSIDDMERRLIEEALARMPTRTRAAEVLGISLRTLYNKIHRYGLGAPDRSRSLSGSA
jgi:DNA-binding NtrC family response regulator